MNLAAQKADYKYPSLDETLDILHNFSTKISDYTTIEDIYWSITDEVVSKLNLVDCVVYEVNHEEQVLIQKAAFGHKNPNGKIIKNRLTLNFGEGNAGICAVSGKSMIVSDISKSKHYIEDGVKRSSEIEVPIKFGNDVYAVISSEHHELDFYTERHIKFFEIIGSIAVSSIVKLKEKEALISIQKQLESVVKNKSADLDIAIETLSSQFSTIKLENDKRKTLIQEIHHRVNNNLQIITSLLNLYISDSDKTNTTALREIHSRVQTMALIHQNIYKSVEMNLVNVETYIQDLVNHLKGHNSNIYLVFKTSSTVRHLSLNTLVPFGLLINELISLSLKTSYTADDKIAEIFIDITNPSLENYNLSFRINHNCDALNQLNIDEDMNINSILASALVDQLDGDISTASINKQSVISVNFKNL